MNLWKKANIVTVMINLTENMLNMADLVLRYYTVKQRSQVALDA